MKLNDPASPFLSPLTENSTDPDFKLSELLSVVNTPSNSLLPITADKLPVLFTLSPLASTLTSPCLITKEPVSSWVFAEAWRSKSPFLILIEPSSELLELKSNSTELIFIWIDDESGAIIEFKLLEPKSRLTLPELLSLSAEILNSELSSL